MSTTAAPRNPLIFIFVTRFIDAMGFGIVMPVLPQLLLHMGSPNIASATSTAGLLLVTYAVMQFFFAPIVGNLSDQFGRRLVILTSLFAYGVDCLLMGFAPSIGWLFIGRAIAGMAGAVFVPANAFVADITPPEKRASAFGLMGAAFGLGFIAGPSIGGFVGELGPRVPFFVAAALAGINFLFGLIVLPESLPLDRRRRFAWRRANPFGAFLMLKHHPVVLVGALALLCFLLGNNVYPSTWAFFTTARFGWSSSMIGWSLAATGTALALVQIFLTGRIVRRLGELRAALVGLSFATCASLAYAFMGQPWMVFVVTFLGAPQAISYPALNALMSRQIPADAQGELQGGVSSLTSIANVLGPFAMTQTLAFYTAPNAPTYFPGAAFILAATLNLVGVLLIFVQRTRSVHNVAQ